MKNVMKKTLAMFMLAILLFGTAIYTGGCKDDNDMEDVNEETKETIDDAGDEVEDSLD